MNQARSKGQGGSHGRAPARDSTAAEPPYWLVQAALGLVLIAAGTLKLYQYGVESQDEHLDSPTIMLLAEAELVFGIWLVSGFQPGASHWPLMAIFAGYAAASLFQALGGKCSCGCFGGLEVNPYAVFVLDLLALGLLAAVRPRSMPSAWVRELAGVAPLVGLAVGVALLSRWQADRVSIWGVATVAGQPAGESIISLKGPSGVVEATTDEAGRFHAVLLRPGRYAATLAGGKAYLIPRPGNDDAPRSKGRSRTRTAPAARDPDEGTVAWLEVSDCPRGVAKIELR